MQTVTETELTDAILEAAAALGWLCYHARPARTDQGWRTAAQGNGAKGLPDLLMVKGRRMVAAELKDKKGKLTVEQGYWLARLGDTPVETYVWRPCDWEMGVVERILRREPVTGECVYCSEPGTSVPATCRQHKDLPRLDPSYAA